MRARDTFLTSSKSFPPEIYRLSKASLKSLYALQYITLSLSL